jgi:hypothetical protein
LAAREAPRLVIAAEHHSAASRHSESQIADQKKLRALRVQHSTPAVLLFQPKNGEPVRVPLRKKAAVR